MTWTRRAVGCAAVGAVEGRTRRRPARRRVPRVPDARCRRRGPAGDAYPVLPAARSTSPTTTPPQKRPRRHIRVQPKRGRASARRTPASNSSWSRSRASGTRPRWVPCLRYQSRAAACGTSAEEGPLDHMPCQPQHDSRDRRAERRKKFKSADVALRGFPPNALAGPGRAVQG